MEVAEAAEAASDVVGLFVEDPDASCHSALAIGLVSYHVLYAQVGLVAHDIQVEAD